MPGHLQPVLVRVYRAADRLVVAAPMPGLEPGDISVVVEGDRVVLRGAERGPHQHERDLILAEFAFGPYHRELTLVQPVDGQLANVTYDNGVLVLSLPIAAAGATPGRTEIRLEALQSTRGQRVGHVGRKPRPAPARERRAKRSA